MIITDKILKNGFLLIVSGLILDLALAMAISLDMALNMSLKKYMRTHRRKLQRMLLTTVTCRKLSLELRNLA